jgi:DNA-binding NarL/FixJ family response regulator
MKKIRVLVVEDHAVVREGLCRTLLLDGGMEVAGQAENGRKAVALAAALKPDVILMDIAMPRMNGLEATRQIVKAAPTSRIVVLSAHNDDAYVRAAEEAGAVGFILKQASSIDICAAIRKSQVSRTYFTTPGERAADSLANGAARRLEGPYRKRPLLTSRELEVLQLIAEGRANKETAAELGIGMKTVEKHREHLMEKLDIHDTAGLTRYAIGAGLVECDVKVCIL